MEVLRTRGHELCWRTFSQCNLCEGVNIVQENEQHDIELFTDRVTIVMELAIGK